MYFCSAYIRLTVKERDGDYIYVPPRMDGDPQSLSKGFREVKLFNSSCPKIKEISSKMSLHGEIGYAEVREQIQSEYCNTAAEYCPHCFQTKVNIDEFLGDKEDKKVKI